MYNYIMGLGSRHCLYKPSPACTSTCICNQLCYRQLQNTLNGTSLGAAMFPLNLIIFYWYICHIVSLNWIITDILILFLDNMRSDNGMKYCLYFEPSYLYGCKMWQFKQLTSMHRIVHVWIDLYKERDPHLTVSI